MSFIKKMVVASAAIMACVGLAPTALAEEPVEDTRLIVRPGSSLTYTADGTHTCSVGAVGRDDGGRLLAITAGHCDRRNGGIQPVFISTALEVGQIGVESGVAALGREAGWPAPYPQKDTADWSVILLDETKVRGSAKSIDDITGQGFTLTSIGGDLPGSGGVNGLGKHCVTGSTSAPIQGMVCSTGVIYSYDSSTISSGNWAWTWASGMPGDSGGPLAFTEGPRTGEWIGIVSGIRPYDVPSGFYQRADKIVEQLNANPSGIGAGFELVTDTF